MKARLYRITSFVMVVLMAWSLIAPALAEGDTEYVSRDTFWNWAAENTSGLLSAIISYGIDNVCTVNEDGRHRASNTSGHTNILGWEFDSYNCICDACGQHFRAYETDLQQSYDNQVAELPASGYGSDGGLLIPTEIVAHHLWRNSYSSYMANCNNHSLSFDEKSSSSVRFLCALNKITVSLNSGYSDFFVFCAKFWGKLVAPYDGFYQRIESPSYSAHLVFADGTSSDKQGDYVADPSSVYYTAGSVVFENSLFSSVSGTNLFSYEIVGYPAYYKFTPAPSVDINFDTIYNINTRPTSITGGNYGIIGDNGQITTVTNNNQIVNETNNTYYNPATGETSTITDWSYDYSDRSYNLTLEGGDTSTVTYGDENITITETTISESGDTIINNYTIYYIIEGSGSGPATHIHDWRETSVTDATCIQAGRRVYTCDSCGDTKSETIPALGHNWLVLRTVNTEYDEDGSLVTEGYVLYQCDRCQEQYKTTSTSSRPPPGGGTTSGSGTVLDEFPDFVDMLLEMLQQLPSLFSGFVAFLNAMFAYIPEEIIFMLTFGVAAVVLIGIIKAVRG